MAAPPFKTTNDVIYYVGEQAGASSLLSIPPLSGKRPQFITSGEYNCSNGGWCMCGGIQG